MESDFLKRRHITRSSIRDDVLFVYIPVLVVLLAGLMVSGSDGWKGFFGPLWDLIKDPLNLGGLSALYLVGMLTTIIGFAIAIVAAFTLKSNYSSTLVIREGQKLIEHGLYRVVRHPIYFGIILAVVGIPVAAASVRGVLVMLLLVPVFLNRIRMEEKLLVQAFGDEYRAYRKKTKKLIPFIY